MEEEGEAEGWIEVVALLLLGAEDAAVVVAVIEVGLAFGVEVVVGLELELGI